VGEPFANRAKPRIHPTATVEQSYLGVNVQIGPYAKVRNSTLADDVTVEPYAEISESHLDEGCYIESYAHIEQALLGVMVKVLSSADRPTVIAQYSGLGDEVTVEPGVRLEGAIIDPRTHVYGDKVLEFG
jgi:ADP-glucose pyrophosphorylase